MTDERTKRKPSLDHNHTGHRQRLKERFLRTGLEGFAEHEVLELLLFYALPYRDTNDLAHRLINEYGSFAGVCKADFYDLQRIPGVGPHVAHLLTMLPQLSRLYLQSERGKNIHFACTQDLADYIISLFIGKDKENFYLLCLNSNNDLLIAVNIAEGSRGEVPVYPSVVVEKSLRYGATSVVLAHNHPGRSDGISAADLRLTRAIEAALATVSINVLDHIIIVGIDDYISFYEQHLMNFKGISKK